MGCHPVEGIPVGDPTWWACPEEEERKREVRKRRHGGRFLEIFSIQGSRVKTNDDRERLLIGSKKKKFVAPLKSRGRAVFRQKVDYRRPGNKKKELAVSFLIVSPS